MTKYASKPPWYTCSSVFPPVKPEVKSTTTVSPIKQPSIHQGQSQTQGQGPFMNPAGGQGHSGNPNTMAAAMGASTSNNNGCPSIPRDCPPSSLRMTVTGCIVCGKSRSTELSDSEDVVVPEEETNEDIAKLFEIWKYDNWLFRIFVYWFKRLIYVLRYVECERYLVANGILADDVWK